MTRLLLTLCLSSVTLVLTSAAPTCTGIEFDAITPDEKGNNFFFKDGYLWNNFHGPAQLANETFNHPGHVDAAFRMHRAGNPEGRDYVYLFQDTMVFRYHNHTLEEGYPKEVKQEFPGVPCHLDAAVECPKGDCSVDSVLFFKGSEVYQYDVGARATKKKVWPDVPACTSAYRWMEHYYCFHGNNFTRFHQPPKCSEVRLDAITSDDAGKTYIFAGPFYMRLDTGQDGVHGFPMNRMWKEVVGGVNAVFSFEDRIYLIKRDLVYIYRSGAHYTLIQGYPKSLQEELGIQGPTVDAAFACAGQNTVHIIQVDAALCGPRGVQLFSGHQYYEYERRESLMSFL
ncbi:hypothetical protein CRUP_014763 [Coryphaenoides rupestris]|nr:hypothetical protein CRUP_014763 [Coryphaenoides rupestris]